MVCFSPMGYGVLNRKVLRDKSNFFALLLRQLQVCFDETTRGSCTQVKC